MKKPYVSVIIPSYGKVDSLKKCIEALDRQTYPNNRFEIIIVDNGAFENLNKLFVNKKLKILFEKKRGSYCARNKGIKVAKGTIIAFTDADTIPYPNWIENGVKALKSKYNVGLVAGRIEIYPSNKSKPKASDLFEIVTAFPQKKYVERMHFGATGNLFAFKEVFKKVDDFNADLFSGGDLDWGNRVFSKGYRQIYSKNTVVRHPARPFFEIITKHRRVVGNLVYQNKKHSSYSFKFFLIRLIIDWPRIKDFFECSRSSLLKDKAQITKVLAVMALVKATRTFERIRVYFGGKPIR